MAERKRERKKLPRPRLALVSYIACLTGALLYILVAYAPAHAVTAAEVNAVSLPNVLSARGLLWSRCLMLTLNLVAMADKLRRVELKEVLHKPESALEPSVKIVLRRGVWCTFFTVQSWMLQTVYLAGAALCSASEQGLLELRVGALSAWTLWVVYEVSFAVAILISFLVKFVIIPSTLANGQTVAHLFTLSDLMMHNANVLFMAIELLFNALPFEPFHFPFAALWGLFYVLFSWGWLRTAGVCWYDFLDPTLPNACIIHTVLVVVLAVFFGLGAALAKGAAALDAFSPLARFALVLVGVASVSRTGWLHGVPQPAAGVKRAG